MLLKLADRAHEIWIADGGEYASESLGARQRNYVRDHIVRMLFPEIVLLLALTDTRMIVDQGIPFLIQKWEKEGQESQPPGGGGDEEKEKPKYAALTKEEKLNLGDLFADLDWDSVPYLYDVSSSQYGPLCEYLTATGIGSMVTSLKIFVPGLSPDNDIQIVGAACPSLKRLQLGCNYQTDVELLCQHFPILEYLRIGIIHTKPDSEAERVGWLNYLLEHLPHLTVLYCTGLFSLEKTKELEAHLARFEALHIMGPGTLFSDGWQLPNLRDLQVEYGYQEIDEEVLNFSGMPALKKFKLDLYGGREKVVQRIIAELCKHCPHLETLIIESNNICEEALLQLKGLHNLRELKVKGFHDFGNDVSSEKIDSACFTALSSFPALTSLNIHHLYDCSWDENREANGTSLLHLLPPAGHEGPTLKLETFSCIFINGLQAFLNFLRHFKPTLRRVLYVSSLLTDEHVDELLEALHPEVKELHLEFAEGMTTRGLCRLVSRLHALEVLHVPLYMSYVHLSEIASDFPRSVKKVVATGGRTESDNYWENTCELYKGRLPLVIQTYLYRVMMTCAMGADDDMIEETMSFRGEIADSLHRVERLQALHWAGADTFKGPTPSASSTFEKRH